MDDGIVGGGVAVIGPRLEWEGKREPDIEALRASVRVFEGDEGSQGELERGGVLVRGDALAAAAWMLPSLEGKVDLIYVDPPFAVGVDFFASVRAAGSRPPMGKEVCAKSGGGQFAYCDRWASSEAYLDFLYHLIVLSHRLLADDGAAYLHVDQRASHWARCLMAEVFGAGRDRGTIAWHLGNGVKAKRAWGCTHNDIVCFSKGGEFKFRPERAALREAHAAGSLETHFRRVDEDGRRYRDREVNGKVYRYYADEGRLVGSVWTDCPSMAARSPIMDEATGYPTQKPEKLLERIVEASSDPSDLVLDLCCGSGTTGVVAQRLGRRFVGVDIGRFAIEHTRGRMESVDPGGVVRVVDLVESEPGRAARLAAMLGLVGTREVGECGLVGEVDKRVVAVWPHGVVVTRAMVEAAFKRVERDRRCAAFATQFEDGGRFGEGVMLWRYHPEAVAAASLRSVVFSRAGCDAAGAVGEILRVTPGGRGGAGAWTERAIEPGEVERWVLVDADGAVIGRGPGMPSGEVLERGRVRVVDVYGFTHTLEASAACVCVLRARENQGVV
jgi:site-specific DNA-methyltransferase (adenine-specific)